MGYGRGNVGTAMHLILRGIPGRFRRAKERLQALGSNVNRTEAELPNDEIECTTEVTSDMTGQIFTGGDAFDCSENLAASIIAKLSGVPIETICADTPYEILGVENCVCIGQHDDTTDEWNVFLPIVYEKNVPTTSSSLIAVSGNVDCDLLIDGSSYDPEIQAMKMEWLGPRHLLSCVTGLTRVHEINTTHDNVILRPSPWLFEMIDKYQFLALAGGNGAERIRAADRYRLDCLVNIISDVMRSLCWRIKNDGGRVYNFCDMPKDVKYSNFPYEDVLE